jgi:hypothetical protein
MNKIYKLVWSRLSASLVAVSEISRGSSGGLDDRILNNFFCLALLCLTLFLSPKNAVASCTTSVVFDMLEITGNCDTGYELPSGQSFSTIYLQSGASVEGGILLNGNIQTLGANYYGVGFFPGGLSIQGGVINNGIVNVNSGPGVGTDEVSQSIDFIQNNNSITANQGIFNVGTIGSIDNTGTMIGDPGLAGGSSYGVYNASGANITSISNLAGGVIR